MYTFLACGEELHAPDSYSIELLLIVAQDSESQVQIQPRPGTCIAPFGNLR